MGSSASIDWQEPNARFVQEKLHDHPIVLFTKLMDPHSHIVKILFNDLQVEYENVVINKLSLDEQKGIMKVLRKISGVDTLPQVFIHGIFFGGSRETRRRYKEGELVQILGIEGPGTPLSYATPRSSFT